MEKRKEELEKKRQKLAQLRKQREERKKNFAAQQKILSAETSMELDRSNIDELVSSLVGEREDIENERRTSVVSEQISNASIGELQKQEISNFPTIKEKVELKNVHFEIFETFPVEKVVYSKEIQTIPEYDSSSDEETNLNEQEITEEGFPSPKTQPEKTEPPNNYQILDNNEIEEFIKSPRFNGFIESSTKVVERALDQVYDYMIDYTKSEPKKIESSNEALKKRMTFKFAYTENRSVTSVDWSTKYEELLLTGYNKDSSSLNSSDGLVCVWNLHLKDRPEFLFQAQSDVLCAKFTRYHPNLIIGGTQSGQVVLWDTRATQMPILKSQLTADGHTYPVCSVDIVGTQNSHNYITTSTDGTVCSWEIDMLARPIESIHLNHPDHIKSDELSINAIGNSSNDMTTFWVGTEEGTIYQANRLDKAGGKTGVNPYDIYSGHNGPVTSIDFHPVNEKDPLDFGDLFLSSSFDWKVNLWQTKNPRKPSSVKTKIRPLHGFETNSNASVFCVSWAPQHPAAFGLIDGYGNFDIWNLNQNTEFPIANNRIIEDTQYSLTCFKFNNRGTNAAIGASNGETYIYDLGNILKPTNNDWIKFRNVLTELTDNL